MRGLHLLGVNARAFCLTSQTTEKSDVQYVKASPLRWSCSKVQL